MKKNQMLDSKKTNAYYDSFGRKYHNIRVTEGKLFNEYIEIPAVLGLLENLSHITSILDVGCGSGIYAKKLCESGYSVEGVDTNEEMIAIAKEYCKGLDVKFTQCPFEEYKSPRLFDVSLGSFLLGYFEDLTVLFSKMKELLKPDGRIIVSGVHPIRTGTKNKANDGYFVNNYLTTDTYETLLLPDAEAVEIVHHTFEEISKAVHGCGLTIERILEPTPQIKPEEYNGYRDHSFYMRNPSVIVLLLK